MVKDLRQLSQSVFKALETYKVESSLPDLKNVSQGSLGDVLNTNGSLYYQWLACLVKVIKPHQIVELGGAMGTSALMMLSQLPANSKLFSITLKEGGKEFSYIKTNYPQLTKVVGNDLDLGVWPKSLKWEDTDILFIDSEHTAKQLKAELKLYLPLIGKGKLVLLDDIHMEELWPTWIEISNEKLDVSILHHSGFGLLVS